MIVLLLRSRCCARGGNGDANVVVGVAWRFIDPPRLRGKFNPIGDSPWPRMDTHKAKSMVRILLHAMLFK